jgi:hypothetical protein
LDLLRERRISLVVPIAVVSKFVHLINVNRDPLTFFRLLRGTIPFIVTGYHFGRGNNAKAREWSARYFRQRIAPYYAVALATDGLLLILESRHTDAKLRFAESLERLPDIYPEHDEDYVRGYSQLWLSIIASAESKDDFEKLGGFASLVIMRDELANSPARDWLKRRLPLPNRDKLDLWREDQGTDKLQVPTMKNSLQSSEIQFGF